MRTALLVLNLIASLASAGWAAASLVQPAALSGSQHISTGEVFYARMYAARSIPLGIAAAFLPLWLPGKPVAFILFAAAAIQLADVIIAVAKKDRGMILGASIATIVHVFCGLAIM